MLYCLLFNCQIYNLAEIGVNGPCTTLFKRINYWKFSVNRVNVVFVSSFKLKISSILLVVQHSLVLFISVPENFPFFTLNFLFSFYFFLFPVSLKCFHAKMVRQIKMSYVKLCMENCDIFSSIHPKFLSIVNMPNIKYWRLILRAPTAHIKINC